METTSRKPLIVGIGGSTRSCSTTERALCLALKAAEAAGSEEGPLLAAVEQDIALVLPTGVSAAQVAEVLRRVVGPLLERLVVFDEYRGPGIAPGHRGVAWHCTFRDPARTLREAEVKEALTRGLAALEDELGVRRREG